MKATKLERAEKRILKMNFTQAQDDFIWDDDWAGDSDHIDWLLTATKGEILGWVEVCMAFEEEL